MSNYWYLASRLLNPKFRKDLVTPTTVPGSRPSWFALPLTYHGDRGKLVAHLEKNGIETRSMFAGRIDLHPAYANIKYRKAKDLSGANYILEHSFWIGVHPRMTQEDREYVVKVFDNFFNAVPHKPTPNPSNDEFYQIYKGLADD